MLTGWWASDRHASHIVPPVWSHVIFGCDCEPSSDMGAMCLLLMWNSIELVGYCICQPHFQATVFRKILLMLLFEYNFHRSIVTYSHIPPPAAIKNDFLQQLAFLRLPVCLFELIIICHSAIWQLITYSVPAVETSEGALDSFSLVMNWFSSWFLYRFWTW